MFLLRKEEITRASAIQESELYGNEELLVCAPRQGLFRDSSNITLFVGIVCGSDFGFHVCDFVDENPSFIHARQGLPEPQSHSPIYYFKSLENAKTQRQEYRAAMCRLEVTTVDMWVSFSLPFLLLTDGYQQ